MEKHGVCPGEGEEPAKEASDARGKCCGGGKCGADAASRLSEAVADSQSADKKAADRAE